MSDTINGDIRKSGMRFEEGKKGKISLTIWLNYCQEIRGAIIIKEKELF